MSPRRPTPSHLPETMAELLLHFRRRSSLQTAPAPEPRMKASALSKQVHEQRVSSSKTDVRGRVCFAPRSLLAITEPVSEDEIEARWYSKPERDGLKQQLQHDVRRLVRTLSTTPMSSIYQEQLYECVGLERFTSRDVLHATTKHRSAHVRAVLEAQAEQRMRRRHNAEELACVSRQSSGRGCAKAAKIAAGYWNVLHQQSPPVAPREASDRILEGSTYRSRRPAPDGCAKTASRTPTMAFTAGRSQGSHTGRVSPPRRFITRKGFR